MTDSGKYFISEDIYSYDTLGNTTDFKNFCTSNTTLPLIHCIYEYNTKNQLVSQTAFIADDMPVTKQNITKNTSQYIYDDKNNLVSVTNKNQDGSTRFEEQFFYHCGNKTGDTMTGTGIFKSYRGLYIYSDNGNTVESKTIYPDHTVKQVRKYNSDGDLVETDYFEAGDTSIITGKTICKHDGEHRTIKSDTYKNNLLISTTVNQSDSFDAHGNPLKEIFRSDKINGVTESRLTYY